jgi:hypothetical protein
MDPAALLRRHPLGFDHRLLFAPLYQRLMPRVGGRRSAAALLTMAVALVIVILPAVLLALSLAYEASLFYEQLRIRRAGPRPGLHADLRQAATVAGCRCWDTSGWATSRPCSANWSSC